MRKIKRINLWEGIIGQKKLPLEEKFFNGLIFLGIFGWFFSFLGNLVLQFGAFSIFGTLLFFLTHFIFYYFSRFERKIDKLQTPFVIYALCVLVFTWLNNGGIDGGALYIYGVLISISIIIMKKDFAVFMIMSSVFVVICLIYIEYYKPNWITRYETSEDRFLDLGISILASMVVANTMIFVIFKNYIKINKKSSEINEALDKTLQNIKKDLSLSARVQRAIISTSEPSPLNLETFINFLPVSDIGGDIYSIEQINRNKMRIFLADATGHGVQAALITMLIYSEFYQWNSKKMGPAETLKKLNETFISKYRSLNIFFTCIIIDLDISKKKLTYASGGHIDQLIIRENGEIVSLPKTGVIIGFQQNSKFLEKEKSFSKDDIALLFTDGILEEFGNSENYFGMDRLKNCIRSTYKDGLEKINQKIFEDLNEFLEGRKIEDDVTLIIIKNKIKKN
ncbi:MAG: serine/threonine-protein phosphatase [Leptospiraceae bacterium]|nr:serine/threonine-protein phosphatase [Leptospiraceae bacterium]